MPTIQVFPQGGTTELGYATNEDLVQAISQHLPGFDVGMRPPTGQGGRGPDWWIELARTVVLTVPWDSVADASINTLISGLSGWLGGRVRRQRERSARGEGRVETRAAHMFPPGATREQKETLLRTTPYRVTLLGPNHELLSTIEQDESMEEPVVKRHYQD